MKIKKYFSKITVLLISASLILSYSFSFSKKTILASSSSWSTPEEIAQAEYFDAKLDSQKKLHFVYYNSLGGGSCYYKNNISGTWSTPENVSGDIEICSYPAISIDNNDKIHLVFVEKTTEGETTKYYVNYTTNLSGTWSEPERIGETADINSGTFTAPNIVIDSQNNPHVIYQSAELGLVPLLLYKNKILDTWSDSVSVTGERGGLVFSQWQKNLPFTIDSSNNLHVFSLGIEFEESTPLGYAMFYSKKTPSGSWSTERISDIFDGTSFFLLPNSITVDPQGKPHITYNNISFYNNKYSTTDNNSETISALSGTKIAQKIQTTEYANDIISIGLLQSEGGNLIGNIKLVTDEGGHPSNNVIRQKTNVVLNENNPTEISFFPQITVSPLTTYWIVFEPTSGSGNFAGGIEDAENECMYYDGSDWKLSENLESMYFSTYGLTFDINYGYKSETWHTQNITSNSPNIYLSSVITVNENSIYIVAKNFNFSEENIDQPAGLGINYFSKSYSSNSWSDPETIETINGYDESILSSQLILLSGSLHLLYAGLNGRIYYTTSNITTNNRSPIQEPRNQEPGLKELPQTGNKISKDLIAAPILFLVIFFYLKRKIKHSISFKNYLKTRVT